MRGLLLVGKGCWWVRSFGAEWRELANREWQIMNWYGGEGRGVIRTLELLAARASHGVVQSTTYLADGAKINIQSGEFIFRSRFGAPDVLVGSGRRS